MRVSTESPCLIRCMAPGTDWACSPIALFAEFNIIPTDMLVISATCHSLPEQEFVDADF